MLTVMPVPAFRDNYIWLIRGPETADVAVVDPGDARPVLDILRSEGLRPVAVLITHHHLDHTGGILEIVKQHDIPVYGPANENIPGRTHALVENDVVNIDQLGACFQVLELPGHTTGAIAYYGDGKIFVGDTLFMAGCGRLFEGTPSQMHASLAKLRQLPDDTLVYCAHEYTLANLAFAMAVEPENPAIQQRLRACEERRRSNLPTVPGDMAQEKATNPFLRSHVDTVYRAAAGFTGRNPASDVEVFAAIRSWKDQF